MNTLTWLLYTADVLYAQATFLMVGAVITPLTYLFFRLISGMEAESIWSWDSDVVKKKKRERQSQDFVHNKWFLILPAVVLFLLNFIPSRDTFYLMAASEAGEMVVNTPEAQEILKDLKEILSVQLDKLKN